MAPVAARRLAPAAAEGVNFGDLGFYAGGFSLPEGDYALEFTVQMYAGTKQDGTPAGPERLGIMLACHPLSGGEALNQFLSMGSKAGLSFAPNPTTGKGVVPVPGGPATSANNSTNWFLFLKSLYDCGLPQGIFTNDLTTLDGIHVHIQSIPEPEGRKGFGSSETGEVQAEQKGPRMVPVVTEIKEDGKPWEGSGGLPSDTPAAAPKAVAKVAPKVAPKAAPKAAAPAPVEAEAADVDEDTLVAGVSGISEVITASKTPGNIPKLTLRVGTFKAVTAAAGPEMAQTVQDTFFSSDAALNGLLAQVGYSVVGASVKPTA